MTTKKEKDSSSFKLTRSTTIVFTVMIVSIAVILATMELSRLPQFVFISDHQKTLISGEMTIFVITLVELIGRAAIRRFRKLGMESVGYSIRAVLRGSHTSLLPSASCRLWPRTRPWPSASGQ